MTSFKKELLKYAFHSDPNEGLSKLYWEADIFKAVRSWLEQKRQELNPNYSGMMNGYPEDIPDCAKADLIDELLEEIKQ